MTTPSVLFPSIRAMAGAVLGGLACLHTPAVMAVGPAGYAADSAGSVVRTSYGECVHTRSWQERMAIMKCEPKLARANQPEPEPDTEMAAMEPEPEPKRVKRRINLKSDAYFEFDSATLTEDGKQKLDRMARQLRTAQDPSIRIVGHTDRIGPEAYNMKLSRDRAQAVRDYLTRLGVPARVMSVAGRGEAEPIERCDGMRGKALIDCLQPNRRTDIEFSAFEVVEEPAR